MTDNKRIKRLEDCIKILIDMNDINNDIEEYQYELCQFALGRSYAKPKPEDYGLPAEDDRGNEP